MTIVFQGPVISDTHRQDCEMARMELEVHGDSVEGRLHCSMKIKTTMQ